VEDKMRCNLIAMDFVMSSHLYAFTEISGLKKYTWFRILDKLAVFFWGGRFRPQESAYLE
jgi:hypothetical protein